MDLQLDLSSSPGELYQVWLARLSTRSRAPQLRGWAPPRKRKKRVFRKLAARGFAQHFGGKRIGPTQRRDETLADRLRREGCYITATPVGYNGEDSLWVAVPPSYGLPPSLRFPAVSLARVRPLVSSYEDEDPSSRPNFTTSVEVWNGKRYGIDILPWVVRICISGVIYLGPKAKPGDIETRFEQAGSALTLAFENARLAAPSPVIRQTCYSLHTNT